MRRSQTDSDASVFAGQFLADVAVGGFVCAGGCGCYYDIYGGEEGEEEEEGYWVVYGHVFVNAGCVSGRG